MSTVDIQDRASSWRWQRDVAADLVAGHGKIVLESFDDGVSRRVAWPDRPRAARLLAAIADADRGFDAVAVGEYERAFTGRQLDQTTPDPAPIQVGPLDPGSRGKAREGPGSRGKARGNEHSRLTVCDIPGGAP
jgi:hypothetical protein